MSLLFQRWGGGRKNVGGFEELWDPQLAASQEMGTCSPAATRTWTLPKPRRNPEADSCLEPPDKSPPWPTGWFWPYEALNREPSRATWTCDLRNREIVSGCCFKWLHTWYLLSIKRNLKEKSLPFRGNSRSRTEQVAQKDRVRECAEGRGKSTKLSLSLTGKAMEFHACQGVWALFSSTTFFLPFPPAAMSSAQLGNTPLIGLMSGMSIQFFMRFSSFSVECAPALQS